MDEGTLIMSGVEANDILDSIKVVTSETSKPHIVNDYDVDHVGSKVVKIIMSYTGYINRTVWRKY
jgi:UDP-N-acetylglucosamine 2-epimerase